jgi:hypothetical protein
MLVKPQIDLKELLDTFPNTCAYTLDQLLLALAELNYY